MRKVQIAIVSSLALGLLMGFQNCSKAHFNEDATPTDASSQSTGVAPTPSSATSTTVSTSPTAATTPSAPAVQPPTTTGNQVQNQLGQSLAFISNNNVAMGTVSLVDASKGVVRLYNTSSTRIAFVKIQIDPKSGEFLSVDLAPGYGIPFMCHDPNANPCAPGYWNPSSGTTEPNCSSPLNYSGALNGSVRNMAGTGAWQYYGCQ